MTALMNKFGLSEKALNLMTGELKKFSEIEEALIFGSRAMGNFKKASDIDLVLKGTFNQDTLSKVKYVLDEVLPLPYFFDVLHYKDISNQELKSHIDTYGKVIYKKF